MSPDAGSLDTSLVDQLCRDEPDETAALLADLTGAMDERLRELARSLARSLVLDLAAPARPGGAANALRLRTTRLPEVGGDLDVDESLDALAEARAARRSARVEELRGSSWVRSSTALCLLVDRSGSMGGDRLVTAAVAASAVGMRAPEDHSVVAFGAEPLVLRAQRSQRPTEAVSDDLLGLRGHGVTDLAAALRCGAQQLARSSARRKILLVLSDCRATEGGDPLEALDGLDELAVLAPAGDVADAERLVAAVGGTVAPVAGPSDVAAALADALGR